MQGFTKWVCAASLTLIAGASFIPSASADERVAYPSPVVDGLPYSGAVKAGGMVYVGGVLGTVPREAGLVAGGIEAEARQAFAHIGTILDQAGSSLDQAVKCIVLLSDIDYFPAMNAVFREVFPEAPPTRSTLIVPEIPMGAAIEVDCTAVAVD